MDFISTGLMVVIVILYKSDGGDVDSLVPEVIILT